jgi:quercetin dioxygenase-like cupin family protein
MTVHPHHVAVLEACLGKAARLETFIGYAPDSIVSKTILDKQAGTVTLFAFDKGQKLSEHTSPYDAILLATEGHAVVTIDERPQGVSAGEIIIMPANAPHAVEAEERFKMLLIMIRG